MNISYCVSGHKGDVASCISRQGDKAAKMIGFLQNKKLKDLNSIIVQNYLEIGIGKKLISYQNQAKKGVKSDCNKVKWQKNHYFKLKMTVICL